MKHTLASGHGHVEHMTRAAVRPQTGIASQHRAHQRVGMDVAFHDDGYFAVARKRSGNLGLLVLVGFVDDPRVGKVPA